MASSNSIITTHSHSVALATTMAAVSAALIFLAFRREKSQFPASQQHSSLSDQILRSCLSSDETKQGKKKKKRVQFAESVVTDHRENGEAHRRSCRGELKEMPANRLALYNGILRDRMYRVECS